MDTGTRRRAVWMSVAICILSRITSVHLQASSREYVVAVGKTVSLTCDRTTPGWTQHDNPNISSITWRRGEGSGATEIDLTNSGEARITFTEDVDQHRASIRIANVQCSDAGVYSCLVERELGTESLTMEIITMEVSADPSSVVSEGETVTLTCLISNSAYGTGLVWYHGDAYISQGNRLTLNKVKRSQQGEWKCFLHNQHNSPFASYKLEFRSTGDVGQALAVKKYVIHDGGQVTLSCDESDPGFQWQDHSQLLRAVTWKSHDGTIKRYHENMQDPPRSFYDKDQFPLTLSQVTFSRGGVYTCEFTGYYRTGTLTVELVTMKVSANPLRSVTEGETVTLTCLISNSAYGTGLDWYHGGTYIDQGNPLTLNKVKRIQQGEWKCVLQSQHSRPFASYKLEFRSTGTAVGQAPAAKKYFNNEGGEVSLSCDESDPGFEWRDRSQLARAVTWKWKPRGTTKGSDQTIQYTPRSRDFDNDQFPLTMSNVKFTGGGVYTCEFTGYYRTGTLTMELVTIKVSANPSLSVTEGETVTLMCNISNSAYVQNIVWTHGGIEMNKGNSVLTLHKVKRCQEGEWTCGVKTQTDQASASLDLKVSSQNVCEVKAPAPRKYFVSVGQTAILPCVESDPEFKWEDHPSSDRALTWRWERQGSGSATIVQYQKQTGQWNGDVSKNTARITALKSAFDKDNFSIGISKVQHSDAGLYICHFAGYFRTSSLTRELITMQVLYNTSDTVAEGESTSLTCQLSNDSYAHMVRWIHNGIEISHQSSIVLVKVNAAQSGLLKCAVKRESGEISEVAYNVNVLKNDSEHQATRNYASQIGEGITLPCNESDPGFVWRSSSNESRSVTWYWRPRGDSTVRTILAAHPAGPHAAFSSHLNSNVNISSSAFDDDDFSLTISVVNDDAGGVYTCQVEGYFRSWRLEMELITSQVPGASPYVSVAVGVVLAVLLAAGAAVVAVVGYRRRKLNAAESQPEEDSAYQGLNLKSMMRDGPDPQRGRDSEVLESPSVTNNDAPRQEREGHYQALKLQRKEAEDEYDNLNV